MLPGYVKQNVIVNFFKVYIAVGTQVLVGVVLPVIGPERHSDVSSRQLRI